MISLPLPDPQIQTPCMAHVIESCLPLKSEVTLALLLPAHTGLFAEGLRVPSLCRGLLFSPAPALYDWLLYPVRSQSQTILYHSVP